MTSWSLQPILDSYAVAVLAAAGLTLLLLVGPTFGRLTAFRKWILIGFRVALIGLLLVAMLRPTKVFTMTRRQTAVLVMLMDKSRSMQLPSGVADRSRWEEQRDLYFKVQEELGELAPDIELKLYTYDESLDELSLAGGADGLPPEPGGDQTDIGSNLQEAVQRELGKRLMGVILLGDGAQTAFSPRVELQEAGREMSRLAYPLYTITFGPQGDLAQARDISIENLAEQYTVFVKNELVIRGAVRVRGYVNRAIPVELSVENPDGSQATVATREITARDDGMQVPVEMSFTPQQPGQYKLTLRSAEQPGELVTRNNSLSAFVSVLEGGLRVVYLYGDLSGEQRLLRRSINLSPDIQLDSTFVDPRAGDRVVDLREFLQRGTFDVMLVENVDSTALGQPNMTAIARAIENGRGFMMIGGFNSFGPGGYKNTPLDDVLPITIGRFQRQDVGFEAPISRDLHWWGKLPMLPTGRHAITELSPGDANRQVWATLPPLNGANKFDGVKPRARVLAQTDRDVPLLVAGEYGQGRVLAFAGNSTRLWWQYGRQTEHRRFWRQAILWLARRDDQQQTDVWIKLAQRRFNPGAEIVFAAGAKSAGGEVLADAVLEAVLVSGDGTRRDVSLSTDGDDRRGIIESIAEAGDYLLEVTARAEGREVGTARATFQVLDRDVELSNPAAGHEQMARLANLTRDAGGKPLAPEQLPELLREIRERRDELEIEVQSQWQLGDTALDAWLFVLVFIGLLSTEWGLRKKWGLV